VEGLRKRPGRRKAPVPSVVDGCEGCVKKFGERCEAYTDPGYIWDRFGTCPGKRTDQSWWKKYYRIRAAYSEKKRLPGRKQSLSGVQNWAI